METKTLLVFCNDKSVFTFRSGNGSSYEVWKDENVLMVSDENGILHQISPAYYTYALEGEMTDDMITGYIQRELGERI